MSINHDSWPLLGDDTYHLEANKYYIYQFAVTVPILAVNPQLSEDVKYYCGALDRMAG